MAFQTGRLVPLSLKSSMAPQPRPRALAQKCLRKHENPQALSTTSKSKAEVEALLLTPAKQVTSLAVRPGGPGGPQGCPLWGLRCPHVQDWGLRVGQPRAWTQGQKNLLPWREALQREGRLLPICWVTDSPAALGDQRSTPPPPPKCSRTTGGPGLGFPQERGRMQTALPPTPTSIGHLQHPARDQGEMREG